MVGWIILALVVALLAYIRLAPSDVQRWHGKDIDMSELGVRASDGRFSAVFAADDPGAAMAKLHDAALASPRTSLLAGGPDEGKATYITRSKLIGFPDYTTIQAGEGRIALFARLRFGRKDFGVNGARVTAWAKQAGLSD